MEIFDDQVFSIRFILWSALQQKYGVHESMVHLSGRNKNVNQQLSQ